MIDLNVIGFKKNFELFHFFIKVSKLFADNIIVREIIISYNYINYLLYHIFIHLT
jgi:hypothetical protein